MGYSSCTLQSFYKTYTWGSSSNLHTKLYKYPDGCDSQYQAICKTPTGPLTTTTSTTTTTEPPTEPPSDGVIYFKSPESMTYSEAITYCYERGMELAFRPLKSANPLGYNYVSQ